MATSLEAIEKILADMRYAVDNKKCIPIRRKPNMDTLARLGITWSDAFDTMYELTIADYFKGPEDDRDEPTTDKIWVFKKHAYGAVLYIKFKVEYQQNGNIRIISFHIDNI